LEDVTVALVPAPIWQDFAEPSPVDPSNYQDFETLAGSNLGGTDDGDTAVSGILSLLAGNVGDGETATDAIGAAWSASVDALNALDQFVQADDLATELAAAFAQDAEVDSGAVDAAAGLGGIPSAIVSLIYQSLAGNLANFLGTLVNQMEITIEVDMEQYIYNILAGMYLY
jgi:hypothetical protein